MFNFVNDDYTGNSSVTEIGQAIIPQAEWASIISDGLVSISFGFSTNVNCCAAPYAFTSGTIVFKSLSVSEPSTIAIFAFGLASCKFRK